MAQKPNWRKLNHEQKVRILAETPVEQIVSAYTFEPDDSSAFREHLARELKLWEPKNVASFERAGKAPTKDVVLGAWRDLERSEALLELIDNSVDVWLQRKQTYPKKTAPELNIYIDIDESAGQLAYEDNAGGVSVDKLENLVVPGFSETTPVSRTIGSYKTGGKKAIFRLATAVRITTRYWSPAETSDEALSVQLDQSWIQDPTRYEFPFCRLKDKSAIDKGQTRYVLQLREEPIGGPPWFQDPERVDKITREIQCAYSLLLLRNPSIHIHFRNRQDPIAPLSDLYSLSGTKDEQAGIDIRPQQVVFDVPLDYEGKSYPVEIEIILGCRTTSGVREGNSWASIFTGTIAFLSPMIKRRFRTFSRRVVAGISFGDSLTSEGRTFSFPGTRISGTLI